MLTIVIAGKTTDYPLFYILLTTVNGDCELWCSSSLYSSSIIIHYLIGLQFNYMELLCFPVISGSEDPQS